MDDHPGGDEVLLSATGAFHYLTYSSYLFVFVETVSPKRVIIILVGLKKAT